MLRRHALWGASKDQRLAARASLIPKEARRAAATDEATRQMQTAGRSAWSREDYNTAVRTYDHLQPFTFSKGYHVTPLGTAHAVPPVHTCPKGHSMSYVPQQGYACNVCEYCEAL